MGNFPVQLDVLGDGKAGQQHELLMHHADAHVHGILGGADVHLFPVQKHLAFKAAGAVDDGHTKQRVHECGFARAVFTQKRMDLAFSQFKLHIVQGSDTRESLGDIF